MIKIVELTKDNEEKYLDQIVELEQISLEAMKKEGREGQLFDTGREGISEYVHSNENSVIVATDENDKVEAATYVTQGQSPFTYNDITKYFKYGEKYKQYVLKKSNAGKKDQSYVLYNLPRQMTDKVLFPLGDFENKEQIRKIAEEHNLQVARKPDSEDICFIPEGDYKKFLEANSDLKAKVGNIVNTEGKILGKHEGLYKYTIGQRKGLGISNEVPLFVKGFNPKKNELIVGEETEIFSKEAIANEINLILMDEITRPMDVKAKIRYAAKEAECTIHPEEEGKIRVVFNQPQRAITPGQSVVFYIDDIVLGGGKICDL